MNIFKKDKLSVSMITNAKIVLPESDISKQQKQFDESSSNHEQNFGLLKS